MGLDPPMIPTKTLEEIQAKFFKPVALVSNFCMRCWCCFCISLWNSCEVGKVGVQGRLPGPWSNPTFEMLQLLVAMLCLCRCVSPLFCWVVDFCSNSWHCSGNSFIFCSGPELVCSVDLSWPYDFHRNLQIN